MLKLTFGLWKNDNGTISGTFTVFGKKFICFINENESMSSRSTNSPIHSITIMEAKNATQSGS
jgi:hypothetical protein